MRSLNIAASGMLAQQLRVEVTSNNLASLGITAFKSQRPEFADVAYQNVRMVGSNTTSSGNVLPTGMQVGLGAKPVAISRVMLPGEHQPTGNPLDVSVDGRGYFKIEMPNNATGYTRAGNFKLGPTGVIVTSEGYPLQPQLTIPIEALEVAISPTGEVMVKLANQPAPQQIGTLELINFANPGGLEALGDNLFQETKASGSPTTGTPGNPGFGTLRQGYLEASNVDPVKEMTNLVTAQRYYEMNAEAVRVSGDMMSTSSRLRTA